MRGRVCLVTGATSGIGRATALGLARLGAHVVMVGRDAAKGEAVRSAVARESGNAGIEVLLADLSSQAGVRRLAAEVAARHPRLHVLVNNAGGLYSRRTTTADGLELTFALNVLAPFLLTDLLRPALTAAAPARVITVASSLHARAKIDFDDLQGERRYRPLLGAYAGSKLAVVLLTYELARRLEGTGVSANVADPGSVRTNVFAHTSGALALMMRLGSPFYQTPERGAETLLYLAASPDVSDVSGRYFAKAREASSSPASHDRAAAARLWDEAVRLTTQVPIPMAGR